MTLFSGAKRSQRGLFCDSAVLICYFILQVLVQNFSHWCKGMHLRRKINFAFLENDVMLLWWQIQRVFSIARVLILRSLFISWRGHLLLVLNFLYNRLYRLLYRSSRNFGRILYLNFRIFLKLFSIFYSLNLLCYRSLLKIPFSVLLVQYCLDSLFGWLCEILPSIKTCLRVTSMLFLFGIVSGICRRNNIQNLFVLLLWSNTLSEHFISSQKSRLILTLHHRRLHFFSWTGGRFYGHHVWVLLLG